MRGKRIEELRAAVVRGTTTAQALTRQAIEDIKQRDAQYGAFISLFEEDALQQAIAIDREIADGRTEGRLLGVPVAIKDNICTKGQETSCGSKMLSGFKPPYDATVVQRLLKEGAIIIGKTNMDEFAMGSSTENSAYQVTKNPWDVTKVPGGSSGGAAASVAAGFVPLSYGSDTGGSIRQPAAFCGAVGIKPTYGLVSRYGLIAYGSSLDQIGPIAPTVAEAALGLQVIAGGDVQDATCCKETVGDMLSKLDMDVAGMKIGLPREFVGAGVSAAIVDGVKKAAQVLKDLGAEIVDLSMPFGDAALSAYYVIASAEASSNLARFDGVRYGHRPEDFSSVEDLMVGSRTQGFGDEVKRRIMIGTYALSSGYYDAYYKKAMEYRKHVEKIYGHAFKKCDLILGPASPVMPFGLGEKTDDPLAMYLADVFTVNVNMAGLPALSMPVGHAGGLPVGIQLTAQKFDEATMIGIASRLEQALQVPKTILEKEGA